MTKTWDEFIARQVEAALRQEVVRSSCAPLWSGYMQEFNELEQLMGPNRGQRGPAGGMVWRYQIGIAGQWGYMVTVRETWYVNLTTKKVLGVRKRP